MNACPAILYLPTGRAECVVGSFTEGQPRYTIDGQEIDVDVRIPEDLDTNWFWNGSVLCRKLVGEEDWNVGIFTGDNPPPLCFEKARYYEQRLSERQPVVRQLGLFEQKEI